MTKPISYVFPRRLAESDDAVGKLLNAAIQARPAGPTEERSWNVLSSARTRPKLGLLLFGPAAVVACLAIVYGLVHRNDNKVRAQARAEQWESPKASPGASLPAATPKNLTALPPAKDPARHALKPGEKPAALADATTLAKASEPAPAIATDSRGNTQACATLARDGKVTDAVHCYDAIASGSSMAAELALYEKARLQIRALGELPQALQALNEHGRRFPGGVLHTEVEMTRIELLSRLGRTSEALQLIEAALAGSLGRERGADLRAMRGDIYSAQHQCDLAIADYTQAKRLGVHPSRVAAGEKRCESSNADLNLPEN